MPSVVNQPPGEFLMNEPILIRKVAGKIELLSGSDQLPEGKAVRVYTEDQLRRRLGLEPVVTTLGEKKASK